MEDGLTFLLNALVTPIIARISILRGILPISCNYRGSTLLPRTTMTSWQLFSQIRSDYPTRDQRNSDEIHVESIRFEIAERERFTNFVFAKLETRGVGVRRSTSLEERIRISNPLHSKLLRYRKLAPR